MNSKLFKFIICGIVSEFLYLLFWIISLFKENLHIIETTINIYYLHIGIVCILLILLLLYIKSCSLILKENISIKIIVSFAIIFNLSLIFIPPITSSDLYTYISRSRIVSEYHENPYLVPFSSFPNDELYSSLKTRWSNNTAIYGPLFTSVGSALTYIAGSNLFLNIFLFKFIFVICNIFIIFIIQKLTKNKIATFLYSWNPFIIFEFALNSHNDAMLILLTLLSLFYFFKKSSIKTLLLGWVLLILSVLIKFFTLIFLPFYLLFAVVNSKLRKEKINFFILACLLGLFFVVLTYLPYWEGFGIFNRLRALFSLISPLPSIGIMVISIILRELNVNNFILWGAIINKSIFIITYFFLLLLLFYKMNEKIHEKRNLLKYYIIIFSIFLATFFTWLLPWYITTLITLLIVYIGLIKKYRLNFYIYILTMYGIIYYLVQF
jgi:hypothetical protein